MDDETIDSDIITECVEAAMKRLEKGDIPDEAHPSGDVHSPAIAQKVRTHLRVAGAAGSVAKTVEEILEVSKGDELLARRLQTDPGVQQWLLEVLEKMTGIELERRIQAGELICERRDDGGTHVRRA